jgi:hypothetical protein
MYYYLYGLIVQYLQRADEVGTWVFYLSHISSVVN